jgi:U3 small nucleolar RNA-associated protein 5
MHKVGAESDAEEDEPTFGELVAARGHGIISIADNLQPDPSTRVPDDGGKSLAIHSGISLATVLTQSLRTNDTNLLESCFHATDIDIIKSTIQRLDSSLAGILLSKLAERLSSRPGRYGHLLTWVQWTCVVHGGAIAGRPDVASKLRTLYKVLTQRANSLEPLLLLKGKLDMLDAQLTLRKEIQTQRRQRDPQDESGIIYIEGHDNWSSDEDETGAFNSTIRKDKQSRKTLEDLVSDLDSEDDDDMPMMNGVVHSDSENEDDDDDDDEAEARNPKRDGLVDDEAEVSDEQSHLSDEEEDDSSDEESSDDEEEDEGDSELDSFINDDSISLAEDESDIEIDGDDTPEKPPVKRAKRA